MESVTGNTISSRQMRAAELNAEYFGISRLQLMENAGRAIAYEVIERFSSRKTSVAVFCGLGGNGGDGFVAARHLLSRGYTVKVIIAGNPAGIEHEATLKNWQALRNLSRDFEEILEIVDSSTSLDITSDVTIDALLGIGMRGAPRQPILQLVRFINQMDSFCIAVDTPTGLNADTGEAQSETVNADLTITFHKVKPGLLAEHAKAHVGELLAKDIGLPRVLENFTGPGDVGLVIRHRPDDAHKGDFGKLLIIGGSETYSGAPLLAAQAALRSGVDLTYIASPEKTAYTIAASTPNVITIKLKGKNLNSDNFEQLKPYLQMASAVLAGPGLGLKLETQAAVKDIVNITSSRKTPLALDADGLKAFAEFQHVPEHANLVLTPHASEFSILTGKSLSPNVEERIEKTRKAAAKLGVTILLKGAIDVISNGERIKLNFTGNPGMTVGGTGDVLAGIVGALLAQGADPFEAAVAASFVNGAAGDFAESKVGYHMMATDLLEWIPTVMDCPMSHLKVRRNAS